VRLKEQRLWDSMRNAAPSGFWLQRVENVIGDGMPDVFVAQREGRACWVELKAPTRPKRETTRLLGDEGLRTSQVSWHLKAAALSQRTYVLIRDDKLEMFLVAGQFADEMNEWPLKIVREASLATTWPQIFEVLK
jgi:hypothetical protein